MRSIAIFVITSLLMSTSAYAQEADAWRKVAEGIPLGTKVRIQTIEGKRISGTLMRVDEKEILVKKNTRRPAIAYYGRAVAHELGGNVKQAYRDYRQASLIEPKWRDPQTELARFTVRRN